MNIAIIGAGATGLAAAHDLLNAGHKVTVFEAGAQPGGLAGGFKQDNWNWSLEKFYHHWFESDADLLKLASEIGVRKAFGASSWTLIGQFIVENILLTLLGGVLGFILSRLVLQFITNSGWFPYAEFHLNYRIFLGGLGLAILFGLFSGVYPAWKMSRLHPVQALKGAAR